MPTLLSPLSVAGLTFRNRIVMPPMWSGQATPDGLVTDAIVEYHRRRAAAGCALIIVEHSYVHPWGRQDETQLGVHADAMLPGLARLAAAIRAEGAVACLQLAHAGSRTTSAVIGRRPLAPSTVRHPFQPRAETPEALTVEQIQEVVAAFGAAAVRGRHAGFDAVEIHAAHGFLLSQFLSPLTNLRTDDYGGDETRRARLHVAVLTEVRCHVGRDYPVFVRLGAHDEAPGGLETAAACRAAGRLVEAGANLIDVSGGLQGSGDRGRRGAYFVAYAEAIKGSVDVPVLVTGGITDPDHADRLVRDGRADLIGIGRAMLNDPDWARIAIERLSRFS
jgi:2,4-dienoyl-CoA reductase-like NADH-dependent reductase (Old Yellow Enzyme family)